MALIFGLASMTSQAQELSGDTLDSLLHEAVNAFTTGDYSTSAELFDRIEDEFGHESVFEEGSFLRRILPLKGYSELQSGSPGRATRTFERYLERFDRDQRPNAFVLYHAGLAQRRDRNPGQALRHFESYTEHYPDRSEAALATLQKAEILFGKERVDEGFALVHGFLESDAPAGVRTQARLLAVRRAIEHGQTELAAILLLEKDWEVDAMPEVAVLTFAAMELGDRLVEEENHADALRSYRLALPRDQLIRLQKERIQALRDQAPRPARIEAGPGGALGAGHDFHRNLYGRMREQLVSLQESEDYTPALTLRRGQAYFLARRHRSAWLLFESLALDENLGDEIRRDAHYLWILAAHGLEEWDEALTIARNFTRRYEDSELAPQAFYLIAEAHSEQRRYPEAIEVLTDLIERFPEHALSQRWNFTRGFSYALLDRFEEARADFKTARDGFDESHLTAGSDLWYGLTFFFEQDYPRALEEFDRLAETYPEHRLTGEILYRRASTFYAAGDLEPALGAAREFTENYPRHERHGEALVLTGDILMGKGELEPAVDAFEGVPPESGPMFDYAVFQIGKVHRAREDHESVISHFRNYLERDDLPSNARISEALYRIGRAYTELDRIEQAFPVFLETLHLYGNQREAGEIASILAALEHLHRRLKTTDHSLDKTAVEGARTLFAAENFSHWLEAERERALRNERLTWYARLTLKLSDRKRAAGQPHRADTLLLEISDRTHPEVLDARCLGRAGHFLRESGLTAGEELLRELLEAFPNAPERAYSHYGLARIAYRAGDYEKALRNLRRFQSDSPGHELAAEARLLEAAIQRTRDNPGGARAAYKAVLEQRAARGRPHALALRGLAEISRDNDEPDKAIGYYQRIYTLYRAYRDLVAEAYFESALLFEEIEDFEAAYNTLAEMRETEGLDTFETYEKAEHHKARLRDKLPEDPESATNREPAL